MGREYIVGGWAPHFFHSSERTRSSLIVENETSSDYIGGGDIEISIGIGAVDSSSDESKLEQIGEE